MAAKKIATKTTTAKRTPRTKAEITSALNQTISNMEIDPNETVSGAIAKRTAQSVAVKAADQLDSTTLINKLSTVGLEVNGQIGALVGTLTSLTAEYKTLSEALNAKKEELEVVNDIETIRDARQAEFEDFEKAKAEYTSYVENAKNEYEKQLKAQEQSFKDNFAALEKQRKAEIEQYEYNKTVQRRNEEDQYTQAKLQRDRAEADKYIAKQKEWAAREEALKANEVAYKDALTRIAGIENEIKTATDKAVATATGALKKDLLNDFAMKAKDFEAANSLQKAQMDEKDRTITALRTQMASLEAQNQKLQEQVTQIATKAIEGASSETAFNKASSLIERSQPNGAKSKQS